MTPTFDLKTRAYLVTWIDGSTTEVLVQRAQDAKSMASVKTGRPMAEAMKVRTADGLPETVPEAVKDTRCDTLSTATYVRCLLGRGHAGPHMYRQPVQGSLGDYLQSRDRDREPPEPRREQPRRESRPEPVREVVIPQAAAEPLPPNRFNKKLASDIADILTEKADK